MQSYVGDNYFGRKIFYVTQGEKKGTFGALISAKDFLGKKERFLVLNGDDIHNKEELEECLKYPRSLGVQKMIMPNYYSIILDERGYAKEFKLQTENEKKSGVLVATGAYVLDFNIFDHPGVVVTGGEYGLPQSVFAQINDYPIFVVVTNGWVPINSLNDLDKARECYSNFPISQNRGEGDELF